MRVLGKLAAVLVVSMSLAACAAQTVSTVAPDGYTFRHNDFDFKYAWKTSESSEGVKVEGLMKSVRYGQIEDLDVSVALLDRNRQVIAQDMAIPVPQQVKLKEVRSFELLFPKTKLSEVDQIRFSVGYHASDGGTQGLSWKGSFAVKAATGALVGTNEKIRDEW